MPQADEVRYSLVLGRQMTSQPSTRVAGHFWRPNPSSLVHCSLSSSVVCPSVNDALRATRTVSQAMWALPLLILRTCSFPVPFVSLATVLADYLAAGTSPYIAAYCLKGRLVGPFADVTKFRG